MTQNTKLVLIYGGGILFASAFAYWIYSTKKNKPIVVEESIVEKKEEEEEEVMPTKPNPFTELLKKPLQSFSWNPTDYSTKNPFADVQTAIASVNPLTTNSSDRLA
jgi:hypothetical protein